MDELRSTFVTATISGAEQMTIDSRGTPYTPKLSLDNVLIYGCDLWDFRHDPHHQGLEIEYIELDHDPGVSDAADPPRYHRRLDVYFNHLLGPGDYQGEGSFAPSSDADAQGRHYASDKGCSLHLDVMGSGSIHCTLDSASGNKVSVDGSFSCPGNAMSTPVFVAWQPSA